MDTNTKDEQTEQTITDAIGSPVNLHTITAVLGQISAGRSKD